MFRRYGVPCTSLFDVQRNAVQACGVGLAVGQAFGNDGVVVFGIDAEIVIVDDPQRFAPSATHMPSNLDDWKSTSFFHVAHQRFAHGFDACGGEFFP